MTGPSVTVITPVLNGEAYLEAAIRSVCRQTLPPLEMIFVDDGSTDGTAALLAALETPFPTQVLSQATRGQSAARNLAASVARGGYLAFLDHDDIWHPRHLERLVGLLEADPTLGWAYSNIDEMDRDAQLVQTQVLAVLNPNVQHPKTSLHNMLRHDMYVFPSAAVVRGTAFQEVGGFDERLAGYEDDDLFLRLFRAGWLNAFVPESLVRYRRHTASSVFSQRMWVSREIYAQKLMESFPDDPVLGQFFVRDLIAPRFYRCGIDEYLRYLSQGCWDLCPKALELARRFSARSRPPLLLRWKRGLAFRLMAQPRLFARLYPFLERKDPRFR